MKHKYRADIDGLRALAVLSVILYHYGFKGVIGGFVGVDIFFVISGYLITRNIVKECMLGNFSFSSFYMRRVRRLFPALFFIYLLTFAAGFFFFPPQHYERLGGSLIYSIYSLSNIFFWQEAGYFDADSTLKPLLHTWSLSVEEQFYLAWPAILVMLMLLKRIWVLPFFLISSSVVSLYYAEVWLDIDAEAVFYLMPFRVAEFGLGAILVVLNERQIKNNSILELGFSLGMLLVLYSIATLDEQSRFPGLNALIPCVGAALLIYCGDARYASKILTNPLAVGIGLISYSVYLVHWPLFVFYSYWKKGDLSGIEQVSMLVVTLLASVLMYQFVEKPFRRPPYKPFYWTQGRMAVISLGAAMVLTFGAANVWGNNGWKWRLDDDLREIEDNRAAANFKRKVFNSSRRCIASSLKTANEYAHCLQDKKTGNDSVLIIGDSHGRDTWNALGFAYGEQNFVFLQQSGCNTYTYEKNGETCFPDLDKFIKDYLDVNVFKYVILASHWGGNEEEISEGLGPVLDALKKKGIVPIVFGNTIRFQKSVPDLIMRHGKTTGLDAFVNRYVDEEAKLKSTYMKKYVAGQKVKYIDKQKLLCPSAKCRILSGKHGDLVFIDQAHWTLEGARYFSIQLRKKYPDLNALFSVDRKKASRSKSTS